VRARALCPQPAAHPSPAPTIIYVAGTPLCGELEGLLKPARHGTPHPFHPRLARQFHALPVGRPLPFPGSGGVSARNRRRERLLAGVSEASRFSCMKFIGVSGVFDYAGPSKDSRYRPCPCC
jgi:hypothetical protein